MTKNKILGVIVFTIIFINIIINFSYGIDVPEKDVNLMIKNLTRGSEVYLLLPENLLKFNMQNFIDNNIENTYQIEKDKAEKVQKYLEKEDYIGYLEYFISQGFECEENEIEIRHYCFCIGKSEIIDYIEHEGKNYIQIKANLNYNNEFRIIMKDYLTSYDSSDIKFMIDEYGSKTFININAEDFKQNPDKPHITETNIIHTFYSNEDFDKIENAINLTYLIIWVILIIVALFIVRYIIKRNKAKKQEIEDRKFWKKKLTKEEIKEAKKLAKDEAKQKRKNKKGKK